MYSVIYWLNDDRCYPLVSDTGELWLLETLKEADEVAELLENNSSKLNEKIDLSHILIDDEIEARVISIDGVSE
jgi:hypothetical protein